MRLQLYLLRTYLEPDGHQKSLGRRESLQHQDKVSPVSTPRRATGGAALPYYWAASLA